MGKWYEILCARTIWTTSETYNTCLKYIHIWYVQVWQHITRSCVAYGNLSGNIIYCTGSVVNIYNSMYRSILRVPWIEAGPWTTKDSRKLDAWIEWKWSNITHPLLTNMIGSLLLNLIPGSFVDRMSNACWPVEAMAIKVTLAIHTAHIKNQTERQIRIRGPYTTDATALPGSVDYIH